MTNTDMLNCIKDFTAAALIIEKSGAVGVQIHLAHGYLLCEFLDPAVNKRTDQYGGCAENRYRFIHKIITNIKQACAPDFLVTVKINSTTIGNYPDFTKEQVQVCQWLQQDGVDAIEVSGAGFNAIKQEEPYFFKQALLIRQSVSIPVMLVGGFREKTQIQKVLDAGIDFISISRPFITEPGFLNILKSGGRSRCINCNQCFQIYRTKHTRCVFRKDVVSQLEANFPV